MDVLEWLRRTCGAFVFDVVGVYRRGGQHDWPLSGGDPAELERRLADGGHQRRRLADLELIVHEAWRIASRQRSSTTREYLGTC